MIIRNSFADLIYNSSVVYLKLLSGELLLIVEFCRYGNLGSYLTKNKDNFVNQVDKYGNLKRIDSLTEDEVDDSMYDESYIYYKLH